MAKDHWIHIFKGGLQTDSRGRSHYWTDQELEEIAAYSPGVFTSPITINHSNQRKFGQVGAVKRVGPDIYFKPAEVDEKFITAFKSGFFQRPSVEIDHDFDGKGKKYLVGVSFLEGTDPSVENLEPAYFSKSTQPQVSIYGLQKEEGAIDRSPILMVGQPSRLTCKGQAKTLVLLKEDLMALEDVLGQQVSELQKKEAEIAKFQAQEAGYKKTLEDKEKELAAKDAAIKAKEEEIARFQVSESVRAKEATKTEISLFCKDLSESTAWQGAKLGVPPSWLDAGLVEFMASLDGGAGATGRSPVLSKFSAATGEETQLAFFKRFLTEELPKAVGAKKLFSEFAKGGTARGAKLEEDQEIALGKAIAAKTGGKPKEGRGN